MKWAAALLAVLVTGCSAPIPPTAPTCIVFDELAGGLGEVDAALLVSVGFTESCSVAAVNLPTFHIADEVKIEIFDPEGNPFPFFNQSRPDRNVGSFTISHSVAVNFTPHQVGDWRITAMFEPSIARITRVIPVVAIATGTTHYYPAGDLPAECDSYAVSPRGTLVCKLGNANALATSHGQRFDGIAAAALDEDRLWVVRTGLLERYVEQDAGVFVRTNLAAITSEDPLVAIAQGGALWLAPGHFENPLLLKVTPEDDGGYAVLQRSLGGFVPQAMASAGDRVSMVDSTFFWNLDAEDAGAQFALDFGSRESLGADGPTVWTLEKDAGVAYALVDGGLVSAPVSFRGLELHAPARAGLMPSLPYFTAAAFSFEADEVGAVPALVDGKVVLTGYALPKNYTFKGATLRHVFTRSANGETVRVIDR